MKKVSSYTHSKKQLDDYSNQHNPNNKAYRANQSNNDRQTKSKQIINKKALMKLLNELMCGDSFYISKSVEENVCIVKTAGKCKKTVLLSALIAERS